MKVKRPINHFVSDAVWTFGDVNQNGIPKLIKVESEKPKLPRYVQSRQLKNGEIAYYWCPPHWARKKDFPLKAKTLGKDWEYIQKMSKRLNHVLDSWRKSLKVKS